MIQIESQGGNTEDYIQKTKKVCSRVIKCSAVNRKELRSQGDGQSDSLFLSASSSQARPSRDHFSGFFLFFFNLQTFMNCGVA